MVNRIELRAMELAGRQSGYVTRRQALACGISADTIQRRLEAGRWTRINPGLYLISGFTPSVRGRLVAAVATLGAVVSHQSAAELHELPQVTRGMAVVTVPIRTTNRFPDVIVHQSTDLTSSQVIEIDALPTTSIVRTTIDLASQMRVFELGRIVDRIVIDGRASLAEISDEVARLARHGKPGMNTMHRVLELRTGESHLGESELEAMALRLLREWGFPEPVLQHALPWRSHRNGRIDFCYPEIRLIIEIDGRSWHSTLDAFDEDRMRDNHAQLAGWRVLRITYRMLKEAPGMVREMIRRAFDMSTA